MTVTDYIALGIFALVIGLVIFYIVRKKKKGATCIGCPYAEACTKNKHNCGL